MISYVVLYMCCCSSGRRSAVLNVLHVVSSYSKFEIMGEIHPANTDETQTAPAPTRNGFLEYKPPQYRPFQLKDSPVENFRPIRVICIGAGYSGIYLAIRIPERLRNVNLTVYEKNADVGGTWFENRYPGCACDIPG